MVCVSVRMCLCVCILTVYVSLMMACLKYCKYGIPLVTSSYFLLWNVDFECHFLRSYCTIPREHLTHLLSSHSTLLEKYSEWWPIISSTWYVTEKSYLILHCNLCSSGIVNILWLHHLLSILASFKYLTPLNTNIIIPTPTITCTDITSRTYSHICICACVCCAFVCVSLRVRVWVRVRVCLERALLEVTDIQNDIRTSLLLYGCFKLLARRPNSTWYYKTSCW